MIDFKIDGGKLLRGVAAGGSKMVVAEVGYMLALIYSGVKKADPAAAEEFRRMVQVAVDAKESPIWAGDTARTGIFMTRREKRDDG